MRTITYGTTTAPYLATRCLLELANEHQAEFPEATNILRTSFYVDDLLTGSNNMDNAKNNSSKQAINLRKWCSNNISLFLSQEETNMNITNFTDSFVSKTLGLNWNYHSDELSLTVPNIYENEVYTKIILTAEAGQIFDPLGLLSPCIVIPKLLIQKL